MAINGPSSDRADDLVVGHYSGRRWREWTREEVRETIEALVVELDGIAQPYEIAQFRELALEAADAQAPEQLAQIAAQVESLRVFCMNPAKSRDALTLALPRLRHKRG